MKTINVDLGESSGLNCPCAPISTSDEPKKYYPSVTYSSSDPIELPDEGKLIIEFKKVESRESERGDKKVHSCTFEVRKIVGVEAGEDSDEYADNAGKAKNEAGDALDKLRDDYVKSKKKA